MEELEKYKIVLKILPEGITEYNYVLDPAYFSRIKATEVHSGNLNAGVSVKNFGNGSFELSFYIKGVVQVPCDRCLEDVDVDIDTENRLIVKFGDRYEEETDEIIMIPEHEGVIDVSWYMYEFIALSIPAKHIHKDGECNEEMYEKLRHLMSLDKESENTSTDPRWEKLRSLKNNN